MNREMKTNEELRTVSFSVIEMLPMLNCLCWYKYGCIRSMIVTELILMNNVIMPQLENDIHPSYVRSAW